MKNNCTIFSIDPGDKTSGIVILVDSKICYAENVENNKIFDLILQYRRNTGINETIVIIEDVKPYNKRITPEVIDTCKYIGEISYRLTVAEIKFKLVVRYDVKKWVYDRFNDIVLPLVEKKIIQKKLVSRWGYRLKPTPFIIDDRIMRAAMKEHWNIETPKPGKSNRYGIAGHGWQALAQATWLLDTF